MKKTYSSLADELSQIDSCTNLPDAAANSVPPPLEQLPSTTAGQYFKPAQQLLQQHHYRGTLMKI